MNVEATIASILKAGFPAGSVVAGFLVTLTALTAANSPPALTVPVDPSGTTKVEFALPAADTYTATAVAVDANGNTFDTEVTSAPLVVTGPTSVSLTIPSSISLAQTA